MNNCQLKTIFKGILIFGFGVVFISISYGQNSKIDSLRSFIELGKIDSVSVKAINELCLELIKYEEYGQATEIGKKGIELSEKIGFVKGEAQILKTLGIAEYYQGNYVEVFNYWSKSLEAFEASNDLPGVSNILRNLGVIYYDQGAIDKALEYYLQSLKIAESLNDPLQISSNLLNIGGVYLQMNELEKSLNYFQKIEPLLPVVNDTEISSSYLMGIGETYSLKGDHPKAKEMFLEALKINNKTQDHAHNLTMLGKEEVALGNIAEATSYFDKAYSIAASENLILDEVQTLLAKGDLYQEIDPRRALESYSMAEDLAKEIEIEEELRDIYFGASVSYKAIGDYKNAYSYQNKYLEIKDKIFNLETDDKIRGLQFDFDLEKKQDEIGLLEKEAEIKALEVKRQKYVIYGAIFSTVLIFLLAMGLLNRYKYVKKTNKIIEEEKDKSEKLLLNILPEETAKELKTRGKVAAKRFDSVTVLFTDFKGFTAYSQNLPPEELVKSVDFYFSKFDAIMHKHGLEKIKTIGDAYMCAGGLNSGQRNHAKRMVLAAFEIIEFVRQTKLTQPEGITCFDIRIGLNTGPVVAGVVGTKKFTYDIWGDTVNVAARMESMSEPGKINISELTYEEIKDTYDCEYRGDIEVKNRGSLKMYFVNGLNKRTIKVKAEKQTF